MEFLRFTGKRAIETCSPDEPSLCFIYGDINNGHGTRETIKVNVFNESSMTAYGVSRLRKKVLNKIRRKRESHECERGKNQMRERERIKTASLAGKSERK